MGKLRFTVTIPKEDSDIAFLNWDRFVNQYAKFNIGHSKSAWITY
jgi:hypothetical protein